MEVGVEKLCAYLVQHLILDFDSEVSMEVINRLLQEDEFQDAQDLRARLFAEKGPGDFLIVIADCLRDYLTEGISSAHIREQILMYLEA